MKSKTEQTSKNDTTPFRACGRFTILQVMTVVGVLGLLATWLLQHFFVS